MQKFKKILVSLCIVILLFNIVSPAMAAKEEYDHKELLEYDGYGQAMYETVVEETTFITGQYTKNKEFVSKSIDQIKDYANFWKNEAKDFIAEDSLRDAIERGGGYLLTVGDWVKKLFGGYGEKYHPSEVISDAYNGFVTPKPDTQNTFMVNPGYVMYLGFNNTTGYHEISRKNRDGFFLFGVSGSYTGDFASGIINEKMNASVYPTIVGVTYSELRKQFYGAEAYELYHWSNKGNFGYVVALLNKFGVTIRFEKETGEPVKPPVKPSNDNFENFRKHVDEKLDKMATPQPRPYLVCGDGTKIQMSISGSTFLGVDGKAMIVNKDGTAEVDSAICKLGWDKPVVKYIDDRAAIETPDGKWQDAETGEMLDGDGGEDGECGMLCSLGKLTKFILDFFEKLLDFFIKIFVPENMDFVTVEFDKLKNNFDEKLGVIGDLKGTMEGFFAQENSNPLADLTISLPAAGGQPLKIIETSLIEKHVPTVKKVMSGILVLTTVFYLYRKITGRGGVMEK